MSDIRLPARMAKLPKDRAGRPIPWFVAIVDGEPDPRIADNAKFGQALRFRVCWVCGESLGRYSAFVIGPMCAINRVSSEPPSHRDCAVYSARACPFLANPRMERRERGKPENKVNPAGVMLSRNPGVALVWVSRNPRPFRAPGGVLFRIGDPDETLWYAEGRAATRAEVEASIESGLPALRAVAEAQSPGAVMVLNLAARGVERLLPAVTS